MTASAAPAFQVTDLWMQAPLLVLAVFGLLLVVVEAFASGQRRDFMIHLTVAGCAAAALCGVILARQLGDEVHPVFGGMLVADRTGMFFAVLLSAVAGATALVLGAHQREHNWQVGEVYPILLLSAAGMVMLAMAGDLVTVFIGIETMSLGVYVLTASRRRSRRGAEAAMKYFLMGAFATAILLYGIALCYGATGTTSLAGIRAAIAGAGPTPLVVVGTFLLIGAFAFKVAAIPFHMWAPDAYEGAPTPVTGFMATAVKVAAFAAILRVFAGALGGDVMPYGKMGWASIFAALAAATMIIGNIAALRQDNIKRMLAYSSISHAGVVLVGVVALGVGGGKMAHAAVLYYLAAYSVTTLGAFAVITWIG
ncbi:MAG TPA: NADH-quinone oxidoreductase subunit N, partial [Kofleriaceae bacterium]|nr:NADH-quinone oxidoreductase subunit N [Kofleriaceae bacterium]